MAHMTKPNDPEDLPQWTPKDVANLIAIDQNFYKMPFHAEAYSSAHTNATLSERLALTLRNVQALRSRLIEHASEYNAQTVQLDELRSDVAAVRRLFS